MYSSIYIKISGTEIKFIFRAPLFLGNERLESFHTKRHVMLGLHFSSNVCFSSWRKAQYKLLKYHGVHEKTIS